MNLVDLVWTSFFIIWILINSQWELIFRMNNQYQDYFYQERLVSMLVSIFIGIYLITFL